MRPPLIRLRKIEIYERPTPFARPFRFGSAIVESAPQAFVRVTIETEGHGVTTGASAEMMMPKWFDKRPVKSPAETIMDLRASLAQAASAYFDPGSFSRTAFSLHAAVVAQQSHWAESANLPALVASYGPAVIDKAILDALLKAIGMNLIDGLRANAPGVDARLTPDLNDTQIGGWLKAVAPMPFVAIRHTIGLLDDPQRLVELLSDSDVKFFKIKINGDVPADIERLRLIGGVLAAGGQSFQATLDGNEQYDETRLAGLLDALNEDRTLASIRSRLLYIEQPFDRATTMAAPIPQNCRAHAFVIDEADDSYDAFPRAAALGYRGVSSKSCKGLYKSILNAVRASEWNSRDGDSARYFISGEDLTCQAGLAVQQDTALVAALGLKHAERNGHYYVDGFGTAPESEAAAFAAAYPDYYHRAGDRYRLATSSGRLSTAPIFSSRGFASAAEPDWDSLSLISSFSSASGRVERTYA